MENIEKYLNQKKAMNFSTLLFDYIDKKGLSDSYVYNKANIDRRLFSKVRCNNNYTLNKQNIIRLCISLELNKEDTSKLLNSAGYTLSASNDFDLTISYCIENNIYDFNIINNYLYTLTNTVL